MLRRSPVTIARLASFVLLSFAAGCGSTRLTLHEPQTVARSDVNAGTPVIDFQPITMHAGKTPVVAKGFDLVGMPSMVLSSALSSELNTRAVKGGVPGGYVVACRLERFAFRTDTDLHVALAILYVDLGCSMTTKADKTLVWRGELRGRAIAAGRRDEFADEDDLWQAYADRTMSDVTRELATDIIVGALHLEQTVSMRAFDDQDAEHASAGVNDAPLGPVALSGDPAVVKREAVSDLQSRIAGTRAVAWNAVAMASAPDLPWIGGIDTVLDDDVYVRFFQYKALARHASKATLLDLRVAHKREVQDLLKELVKDSLTSDGIGFPRNGRTPTDAQTTPMNGDATSP